MTEDIMEVVRFLIFTGVFFTGLYFFVDGLSVIGQIVLGVIKSIFFKEEKNDYSYIDFEEDLY